MTQQALQVFAGDIAREQLAQKGWDPSLFSLLLGASGGPKWLVLSQLDRALFGSFLHKRQTPLSILGTSIGSWRHACLAQDDPLTAIEQMEKHYIHQSYSATPSVEEVSEVSQRILEQVLGPDGARQIVENPTFTTHIGTVRGRGPIASPNTTIHGAGLALAALSNQVSRRWLAPWYQRVMFDGDGSGQGTGMAFRDFDTIHVPLTQENVIPALMASASIPLTLKGVQDPPGAPKGLYWDGGIVDYHHDLRAYKGEGLVLYPHFYGHIIPGWFDKSRKARWPGASLLRRVVLLSPSPAFVSTLPLAKIPDRKDFTKIPEEARITNWWEVVKRCEALATEWTDLLAHSDPLARVRPFPEAR